MKRQLSYVLLVLSTFFWGVSFVVIKEGTSSFSPAAFLAYRFLLAALLLGLLFPKHLFRLKPADWLAGLSIGSLLFAGTLVQAIGLRWTSASNAGFIAGLSLVFLPLLKYLADKTPLSLNAGLSIGIAMTGLASLSLKLPLQFNPGDGLVLLSALIFALQILLTARHAERPQGFDPLALTWVQLLSCGSLCGLYALLSEGQLALPASASIWQAIALTGILATALSYSCQNFAQQYLKDQQVALIFLLEPIFACAAAVVCLNEPLSPNLLLGGGLILLALGISEIPWQDWLLRLKQGAAEYN